MNSPTDDASPDPDGGSPDPGAALHRAVAGVASVVTLHLDDHHLVLETEDGEAVGAWRSETAALDFARTLVTAAPDIRIIVSTWPAAALGALAEHLRRTGWRIGIDWPAEVALLGTGATHDPTEVLDVLDRVGAHTPGPDRPVDEGIAPTGRHHVWHDGDGARAQRTGLEGQPLD